MRKTIAILLAAGVALGAAVPGAAVAKHGADDPAGHVRQGKGRDDATPHFSKGRGGKDDPKPHFSRRRGGGKDDGPNHG